jgi:hypothetical protein
MNFKLSTWLLVALAGGAFATGCGSSSNSTSSSQSTPAAGATSSATPGSSPAGSATPGSANGSTAPATPLTPAQAKQAVSTCKHGVQSQSAIPSGAKSKLEKTCEKAASGDPNALRKVAQEACIELINASHLPSGAIKQRALALCNVNTSVGP